ncbi:hypothetical protein QYF61_014146 [Mycteria americana]|uniref:Uncharacterized protein n=1 Tax=Mycteria americana TaxID=33587 RepID=A0AAN7S3H6_MYCAM|nr:hypothetical protein QYF61_014146 [Mycteria americana]
MKFNKHKCKVLHLGRNNPRHQYTLEDDQLESCFAEKDLWVLVDTELTISQQRTLVAKKAKSLVGCIKQSIASRLRSVKLQTLVSLLPSIHYDQQHGVKKGLKGVTLLLSNRDA